MKGNFMLAITTPPKSPQADRHETNPLNTSADNPLKSSNPFHIPQSSPQSPSSSVSSSKVVNRTVPPTPKYTVRIKEFANFVRICAN